ncbi:MocR-like pyridoxine biosynthesis transcription factor PdxR [Gluconacetobacter takamatsuzukensis]|uniref:MocR-like pyridoxine biosynthesis transcription factor PdxR n=1 Tax=Gluconacetobacter takamatsuzukensis TaxID=1286190 RepID=UPI001C80A61C
MTDTPRTPPPAWLVLDPASGPLESQIHRAIRERILAGRLAAGDRLPSSRALARALGVARSTIVLAYDRLRAEGFLDARAGSATRVAALPAPPRHGRPSPPPAPAPEPPDIVPDALRPGLPDLTSFPHAVWARCLGARARAGRLVDLGHGGRAAGAPELRATILSHIRATRGVVATAGQVVIVPSIRVAVDAIARVALATAADPVAWVEEPGYIPIHTILKEAGARLVPLPCDAEGMDVAHAPGPSPRLICVTPSHQYPTGADMTLRRRLAILAHAHASGAVVLEDDYDSEFQYDTRPVAALQGIDRTGSVAYLGTFSKILAPGLRVAYAVLPPRLVAPVTDFLSGRGIAVPIHLQLALADFIADGHLRAHIRRMNSLYADRMAGAVAALHRHCGGVLVPGPGTGGLQLAARFIDPTLDDRAIARRLWRQGFGVRPLSDYYLGASRPGLLLGIASATPEAMDRAARGIRACVEEVLF